MSRQLRGRVLCGPDPARRAPQDFLSNSGDACVSCDQANSFVGTIVLGVMLTVAVSAFCACRARVKKANRTAYNRLRFCERLVKLPFGSGRKLVGLKTYILFTNLQVMYNFNHTTTQDSITRGVSRQRYPEPALTFVNCLALFNLES